MTLSQQDLALQLGLGPPDLAARLHALCFPAEPWSAEDLRSLAALPGSLAWHLIHDRRVVGLILARLAGSEAEVLTLAVDPRFRRRGLAKVMMATLIEALRRREAEMLYLEMGRNNDGAWALYRSLGFSQIGIRADYYRDGTDAVVLRLAIDKIMETSIQRDDNP